MTNCGPPYARGTNCCKCCPPDKCNEVKITFNVIKSTCSSSSSSSSSISSSSSSSSISSSSSSSSGIITSCCPAHGLPNVLLATFTSSGSSGLAGPYSLTWNGTNWVGNLTPNTGFCNGLTSTLTVSCSAGVWNAAMVGSGGSCTGSGTLSGTCNPLNISRTQGGTATCCNTGYTLTVTE